MTGLTWGGLGLSFALLVVLWAVCFGVGWLLAWGYRRAYERDERAGRRPR